MKPIFVQHKNERILSTEFVDTNLYAQIDKYRD